VGRFFQALQYLKEQKIIRGVQTFTREHDINRRNLYLLQKDHTRDIFQVAWLTYLIRDYNVSAIWLLTGRGDIISDKRKSGAQRADK
jgi:hypothetical protein